MRITARKIEWATGYRFGQVECPAATGGRNIGDCNGCKHWRGYGGGSGSAMAPVEFGSGILSSHVRCAYPDPACETCGRDCACGKGES